MPDHRIDDEEREDRLSEELRDNSVLNLFLCVSQYPWTVDEIAREIDHRLAAEDSVRRLIEAGLLHRLGDFVFPTRTARRADELGVGGV